MKLGSTHLNLKPIVLSFSIGALFFAFGVPALGSALPPGTSTVASSMLPPVRPSFSTQGPWLPALDRSPETAKASDSRFAEDSSKPPILGVLVGSLIAMMLVIVVPRRIEQHTNKKYLAFEPMDKGSIVADLVKQRPSMVWVNSKSGIYYRIGSRWCGKTKRGLWMERTAADRHGYRLAREASSPNLKSAVQRVNVMAYARPLADRSTASVCVAQSSQR